MATNPQMLKGLFDGFFSGGESTINKWSFQTMMREFPKEALQAKIIKGWPDGKGGTYSTSIADHMVYLTQYGQRIEAALAAQGELLKQMSAALSTGVDLQIDYDRIDASIKAAMPQAPEYELNIKGEAK